MSFNQAMFIGNLGQDATRNVVGDSTVCNFSIAVNIKKKGVEEVLWVRCALWGKRAEAGGVTEYLTKGKQVMVQGPVDIEEYTNKESGEVRRSLRVMVNELQLLGGAGERSQPQQREQRREQPKADPVSKNPFE
jgi:single-strand DNA-binding protein